MPDMQVLTDGQLLALELPQTVDRNYRNRAGY